MLVREGDLGWWLFCGFSVLIVCVGGDADGDADADIPKSSKGVLDL